MIGCQRFKAIPNVFYKAEFHQNFVESLQFYIECSWMEIVDSEEYTTNGPKFILGKGTRNSKKPFKQGHLEGILTKNSN